MSNDRTLGGAILVGSIAGIVIYFWLLFMSPWAWLTIQVSAFAAVGMVLIIIAWIGYTLATTPPPMPLEDFDFDMDEDTEIGEEDATKFFNTGKIELKNIENIILFTDGLLLPKENPEEKEDWNKFVKIYKKSGLGGLLKYVRETEESDPKCYLYPRFKKHDDVAAISIKIE